MKTVLKNFFGSLSLCLTFLLGLSVQAGAQGIALAALPDAPVPPAWSSPLQQPAPSSPAAPTPPTTPAPAQTNASASSQSNSQQTSDEQLKAEEKQRLLGIMPAFNTVESGQAAPLRPAQKFSLWYHSAVDPFTFTVAGIDAGIEQAEGTYPEYRQGVEGFAKRFGAAYADNVDGNFWGNAVLPVILHQDPRYYRLGHGSAAHRLWYAAISTVRCKGDNGKWQVSYSNIGGNLIGGAISNIYYPASDRGVGLTLSRGFTVTAEGAFGALAFEFYPDAIAYLKRRHQSKTAPAATPANPAPAQQP